jgi:hypothetical protein
VTTVTEDRTQARIHGLLDELRAAEADWRRCYGRVLGVVAELEQENAGAATGFGTTARLLAGVLNLSTTEAHTRAEQAQLLTPRSSLTGEVLPPALPGHRRGTHRRSHLSRPATGNHHHHAPHPTGDASGGGRRG